MFNSNLNVVIGSSNHLSFILYHFEFFIGPVCFTFKLGFNLKRKEKQIIKAYIRLHLCDLQIWEPHVP